MALATSLILGAGCSSSSSAVTPDAGHDAGSKKHADASTGTDGSGSNDTGVVTRGDAKPHVITDPDNCIAPGSTSNVSGVGGYCSPAGGQCATAIAGGMASVCTADVGAPAHAWFCTVPCTKTSDCGAGGATCIATDQGQVCVPAACGAFVGDAAVSDSGRDGASDASHGHDAAPRDSGDRDAPHDAATPDGD